MPSPTPSQGKTLNEFPIANQNSLNLNFWAETDNGTASFSMRQFISDMIGEIKLFMIPIDMISDSFIPLDGRTVLVANYPFLGEKVAEVEGFTVTDAQITVPNLTKRFLRFDVNRDVGSLQDSQYEVHSHPVNASFKAYDEPSTGNNPYDFFIGTDTQSGGGGQVMSSASFSITTSDQSTGNHGAETRPENVAVIYAIRGK